MGKPRFCEFGKEIKKCLVDIDKSQEWLIAQVHKDTGLYFDSSYLYKIMTGKIASPKIVESIRRTLNMTQRAG